MRKAKYKKNRFDAGGSIFMDLNNLKPVSIPIMDTSGYTPNVSIDVNKGFKANPLPEKKDYTALGMGIGIGANALGKVLNFNNYDTAVGNALSGIGNTVGGALSKVNPILGAAVSGGSALLGNVYNAAFGSRLNDARIAEVNSDNSALNRMTVDNSTSTNLLNQFGSQDWGRDFTQGDIGSDGWFSNKAEEEYNRLKKEREMALLNARQKYNTGAVNLSKNQGDDVMTSLFSEGGKVHIKPSKKGTFTAAARKRGKSIQEFASQVLANKEDYSPAMVKKANFARNVSKWHANGGSLDSFLNTQRDDFTNGVTLIDNGGSHEMNPYEGVQLGVDNNGIPNLVEEGEVIYNDYVYSNRLKVPQELKSLLKLRGTTFADAAKSAQKESRERPNDPISKKGLDDIMNKLMIAQEMVKSDGQYNYANGGKISRKFNTGGLTPYKNYTKLTDNSFYTPEYMNFWNWVKANPNDSKVQSLLTDINSAKYGNIGGNTLTFDDMVRLSHDYKKGPVHQAFLNAMKDYGKYSVMDTIKFKAPIGDELSKPYTRPIPQNNTNITEETAPNETINTGPTWLRYMPAIGAGVNYFTDTLGITNTPDYTPADAIMEAGIGAYNPIKFNPIGRYMAYKPFDRDYYINKFNANSAATKRAIKNTAGNRGAMIGALLASDYNYGNSLGDLARQAEEYNLNQRNTVDTFNRDTDKFNSTMGLDVDRINQAERANLRNLKYNATVVSNAFRDEIDKRISAARSYNLTNFLDNLGDIGREDVIAGWVANNPALYYYFDRKGAKTPYKKSAKGGKIKRGGKQWLTL